MAERTGLEPATPGVTGRYSNQLNYRSSFRGAGLYRANLPDATRLLLNIWALTASMPLRLPATAQCLEDADLILRQRAIRGRHRSLRAHQRDLRIQQIQVARSPGQELIVGHAKGLPGLVPRSEDVLVARQF